MTKEILTVEFRYMNIPDGNWDGGCRTKKITIGIYDTIDDAIVRGNEILDILSRYFEVRADDKFKLYHIFGHPTRLVTNTCYLTDDIQYFAKIEQLNFEDLTITIDDINKSVKQYKLYKRNNADGL